VKLEVRGLSFSYNSNPVLEDVSFRIGEGDFVAIIGPNGSGKSTLLRCIDRILTPTKGCIFICGDDISEMTAGQVAKKLGYVPQMESRLYPSTVFDSVLMGRKPHMNWKPSPKDLKIVEEVIKKLELQEVALRDINHLSGGQRQKVIIGRALAQEPEILLLDEPTANLDLKHQMEALKLIRTQTRSGVSAIAAIHDLNLVCHYCDSVIMLKEGKIYAAGNLDTLTPESVEDVFGVKVKYFRKGGRTFFIPQSMPD